MLVIFRFIGLMTVLALLAASPARAATLFEDHSVLEVRLSGPMSRLLKKSKDRIEHPFVISVNGAEADVQVRIRGNSRVSLCRFPPFRLNFPRSGVANTAFAGLDKVKMVTHCEQEWEYAENSLLNEYLAYRIFNLVSPASYRVRLLRVTYVDTEGKAKGLGQAYHAFLIEPDRQLTSRLGGEVLEVQGVRYSSLDPHQTARVNVFQYLIGNSDWSFAKAYSADSCCHNIDLISSADGWLPIPYDFDLSMLVDARYRRADTVNIPRRRTYGGYCQSSTESVSSALREIRALQTEILAVTREVPAKGDSFLEKRLRFVREFFDADEEKLQQKFQRSCIRG
jgi:hypothetical protein